MNKKFLLMFVLLSSLFLSPFCVHALTIYSYKDFSDIKIGEVVPIKVFIDTEGREINVLEGKLKIDGPVNIYNINTEGSIFNLWPEQPNLSSDWKEINFIGGIAGGVYGKDLRFFNFFIEKTREGEIQIKTEDVFAYLNDGKGTKIKILNSGKLIDSTTVEFSLLKVLNITLIMVILFTFINIWKKLKHK